MALADLPPATELRYVYDPAPFLELFLHYGRGERPRVQLLFKFPATEKLLLMCWLFKFGCSRSLPLYIASKSVLHTQYDVK